MIPVYTLASHLGHVCIYFSIQCCNFSTQLAFYILFELCIFYLLLRSAAANVTCFYTLALSLSLYLSYIHSNVHTHTYENTQRRSGWFLSWRTAVVVVLFLLPFFAVNTAASSLLSIYVSLSHFSIVRVCWSARTYVLVCRCRRIAVCVCTYFYMNISAPAPLANDNTTHCDRAWAGTEALPICHNGLNSYENI